MDLQFGETSRAVFIGDASATIAIQSSLAADAILTGNDRSERRALAIELEVQRMNCPRCQHSFPVGFYCIACGYVPTRQ